MYPLTQPRRPRARRWSLAALFAAWLGLFGYVLGPLAHELLVEHHETSASGRIEVSDCCPDHQDSTGPGYRAACDDPHEAHPCHAKTMLRAALLPFLLGPARGLERAPRSRGPPTVQVVASLLDLAPKTSPPSA